jgi:ABC-type Mn2+/Zn2+ transport system ATPase subunit
MPATALVGGGPVRSGDLVVALHGVVAGFAPSKDAPTGVPIVAIPRLEAARGDRIGIVGPNGVGKTTLLRTIVGDLAPLSGFVRLGAAVQPGYLAQLRGRALAGTTVLDALLAASPVDTVVARSYLARFLFRGEEVFKPVPELSGGERSRLELALLGITPANLLLLDEPTNHLDIPAREALESFLRETPSTLLIVSHDRRLLEGICDRLWVLAPGSPGDPAEAAAFEGGYRAWRTAVAEGWTVEGELELQSRRLDGRATIQAVAKPAGVGAETGGSTQPSRSAARTAGHGADGRRARGAAAATAPHPTPVAPRLSKDAYRRQRALVEEDLTRLGLRKSQIELALGQPSVQTNYVELRRLTSELADVDAALGLAEDAWLALAERAPR